MILISRNNSSSVWNFKEVNIKVVKEKYILQLDHH